MKHKTLVFLLDRDLRRVVLALKKRGFGAGKWNGVGGKVEQGETISAAAAREVYEEIGVMVADTDLRPHGVLHFSFEGVPEWTQDVHIFCATQWRGDPAESEEMRPAWYGYDDVPYDSMWVDDRHWLPIVLAGSGVDASFHLSADGDSIIHMAIETIAAAA